jgi:hypothetical protein
MGGSKCQVPGEQVKKKPLEATLDFRKNRNNPSVKVPGKRSFALGMPVHWAEFYADLQECQGGEK